MPYNDQTSRGLVMVLNPDQANQLLEQQDQDSGLAPMPRTQILSALASHIDAAWAANKSAKQPIEQELLKCMRQRNSEYDPDVLQRLNGQGDTDPIYVSITDIKCRASIAWIKDAMLPQGEVPFKVDHTPVPDLPPEMEEIVKSRVAAGLHQKLAQSGMTVDQIDQGMFTEVAQSVKKELRQEVAEMAQKDADDKTRLINDDLVEGGWYEALAEYIDDFVTYPTAFLKGPILRRKRCIEWVPSPNGNGGSMPKIAMKIVREYQRVSPFDMYPSAGAKSLNSGNLIEHTRYSPADLQEMIGVEGYDEEAIREVLQLHAVGGLKEWLSIDSARNLLEDRHSVLMDVEAQIDALKFMGDVQGKMLLEWGMGEDQIEDPDLMYPVTCVKVGQHVIGARINQNPLKHRGYYCASFITKVGSLWGRGVPQILRDTQRLCNSSTRAIAKNMSMASGPMVWVNHSRMTPGQNASEVHPWKVWHFEDGAIKDRSDIPMGFFMPQAVVQDLLAIYKFFYDQASEVSGIPAYVYGSEKIGGAAQTATGLSMLMDATAKGLRSSVINIDKGVIVPSVKEHWMHIMIYEPDKSGGDADVVPRASDYLMQVQQLQAVTFDALQLTNNPVDMEIIGKAGRAEMLKVYLQRLKIPIDRIVPDRESLINQSVQGQVMQFVAGLAKALGTSPDQLMQLAAAANQDQQAPAQQAPAMQQTVAA